MVKKYLRVDDDLINQKESFNKRAEKYYKLRNGKRQILLRNLLFQDLFREIKIKKKKIMVLEPMCGYGEGKRIIEKYFDNEICYEGFDYSDEIVKFAINYTEGGQIYIQDVTSFTSSKKYDIIMIIGGLHHVPDYSMKVMSNLSGLLNQDGIFINVEPTYNNVLYKYLFSYIKNINFDEKTERRFSLKELNHIYSSCGLRIKTQMNAGLLAYLLWYNPNAFPFLNKGNSTLIKKVYRFDRLFMYNCIGRLLSMATFSVLEKSIKNND
ncbi:methyltransferase domain-containing protein [Lachnospiraceae bacterium]|nr:methyltransferase domain-containing protein [Lachnospiraceae bacterium]